MTNKDKETLSVNTVKNSIVMSNYLDQYITDNDKEPFWDGHVYIYNNNSKTKSAFHGRVAVQIKGRENNEFTKDEITDRVEVEDLKGYLDNGVIYFVVYINSNKIDTKIYYNELSPIIIKSILTKVKSEKSKPLKFKLFPLDGDQKATIFRNFYDNCKKQSSFSSACLFSLEDLEKLGVFEGISISVSGYGLGGKDPITAILSSPIYLYANIKGSPIPQPLEETPQDFIFYEKINVNILVDNVIYYEDMMRIRSKEKDIMRIGDSFSIELKEDGISKINYTSSNNLRTRIKDSEFFIAVYENGGFILNDNNFTINYDTTNFQGFDFDLEKSNLQYLRKISTVLDVLGENLNLTISELTEVDWKNINILIQAFVDKEPVNGLRIDLPPVLCMDICKYKFALLFNQDNENKNTYTISNFFNSDIKFTAESNEETYEVPAYCLLKSEDFLKISNIDFNDLLPAFQKINTPYVRERANWMLLDLLLAYDKTPIKHPQILKTAKDFAEWLVIEAYKELPFEITLLNLFQVYKRERNLAEAEIRKLIKIIEQQSLRHDILAGAYLLLGNQIAAEMYFEKMEPQLQDEFKKYPIYHFWTQNKEDTQHDKTTL